MFDSAVKKSDIRDMAERFAGMQGFKVQTVPIGVLVKVRKPFNLIG